MEDTPYTQREIEGLFKRIDEKLDGIYAQTTKTNGRVTATEREIAELKRVQSTLAVKVAAGVFVASLVMTVVIQQLVNL